MSKALFQCPKMIKAVGLSLVLAIFPLVCQAATPITWLLSVSDSLQAMSSHIDTALEHRIVNSLYQSGVLSHSRSQYRQVKIKLYNTALRPYAIAFLYSKTFFKFHSARINLDRQYHVEKVIPHYHLQYSDFIRLPQQVVACTDSHTKALLFIPWYLNKAGYKPCSKLESESFENQQACKMLSAFKKHYSNNFIALLGSAATVDNFNRYISCPNLQFFMSLSGEDTDPDNNLPAGVAFWAYDPTEINGNTDPKITSSDFNLNASPKLQTAVVGGCHLFSNNVQQGICPVLLNSSRLDLLNQYSSGATSLDIPGAEATYACFANQYLSTGQFLQSMQQCAKANDPLIENNDSHKMYIVNDLSSSLSINDIMLAGNDIMQVATKTKGDVRITDEAGKACVMETGTPSQQNIHNLDQGYFEVSSPGPSSDAGSSCVIINLVSALPFAEQPLKQGSGVVFGTYEKTSAAPAKCMVMKSQFSYELDDRSNGKCNAQALQFSLQGQFAGQVYAPITQAAAKQYINPEEVRFEHIAGPASCEQNRCAETALGQPGYYYVGQWIFKLTDVQGLSQGCRLNFYQNNKVYSDTTGSAIQLLLSDDPKH